MDNSMTVRDLVDSCSQMIGGPVTALRKIVDEFGFVDTTHMKITAEVFNLSVAEVRGIVSFYSDLITAPRGRKHIRICQAEACQAMGARTLTRAVESSVGIRLGETAADGSVTLDPVYCLGVCASGPCATVDGQVTVRTTLEMLVQ